MAYDKNELFQSQDGLGSGPRVYPTTIQPKTFAAGTGTIQKCSPLQFNEDLGQWQQWSALGSEKKVQLDYGGASGGDYTITVNGETTGAIGYDDDNDAILEALLALGNVDSGDVEVSGGPAPGDSVVLTFKGQFKGKNPTVSIDDSTTGGTGMELSIIQPAVNGGGIVRGILFPDDVELKEGKEVIGQVMLSGKVHYDDIVLPEGEDAEAMKEAFRSGVRERGIMVQGLPGFH